MLDQRLGKCLEHCLKFSHPTRPMWYLSRALLTADVSAPERCWRLTGALVVAFDGKIKGDTRVTL